MRTKGAVDMPDDVFRRTVGRLDADIVLNAAHMAMPGAKFEVERDYQLTQQQMEMLQNARNAIERVNPAAAGAFKARVVSLGDAGTGAAGTTGLIQLL